MYRHNRKGGTQQCLHPFKWGQASPRLTTITFHLLTGGGGGVKCESHVCLSAVCYWKRATALTEVMGWVRGQLGSLSVRLRFPWTFFPTDTCWLTRVMRRAVSMERSTGFCLAFSFIILVTRTVSPSFSLLLGKILFRRSHVRDVAMKRLRFIDDYCRVKHNSLSASLPSGSSRKSPPLSHGLHGQSLTVSFHTLET